jgi:hypothetical protein
MLPGADTRRDEKVNSRLFELARLLVRLDHVASFITGTSLDARLRLNYPNV